MPWRYNNAATRNAMTKKIIGYGLLTICLMCLSYKMLVRHEINLDTDKLSADLNQTIIAPAIIDSLNDITRVPTLQGGLVKTINVTVGQIVKKGHPLFSLDSAMAENSVLIHKITLEQSKNMLLIQQKALKHAEHQLNRLKDIDKRAISRADLQEKIHEINMGRVKVTQAQHNLELALANLKNAELTLRQFTTLAPKDGIVLQINAHVNEFVGGAQPIIFLGDAKKIIVRVSLDERDSQRFTPGAAAYISSSDNLALKIPLTFMQMDRYIVTQERLNSRVQEILYYFNRADYPNLVAGQQFDATISIRKAT